MSIATLGAPGPCVRLDHRYALATSNVVGRLDKLLADTGLLRQRFPRSPSACALLLLAEGVPLKTIQDVLGHSQISLTLICMPIWPRRCAETRRPPRIGLYRSMTSWPTKRKLGHNM